MLNDIHKCPKPVEIAVASLCSRDTNLLTAEGIFDFIHSQFDDIGSQLVLDVFKILKEHIDDRILIEIVALTRQCPKHYENFIVRIKAKDPQFPCEFVCILGSKR